MRRLLFILFVPLILEAQTSAPFRKTAPMPLFPLKASSDNRYITYNDGTPFFWNGTAAFSLLSMLTYGESQVFINNRDSLGFNVIMVNLIEKYYSDWPESNKDGNDCFTGADFSTPNEAYFAHVDSVLDLALAKNMVVLLIPAYLGANDADGWRTDIAAATLTTMYEYGQYIGNRYKDYDNIVWCLGGDTNPTTWEAKEDTLADGILSQDADAVFSLHGDSDDAMALDYGLDKWVDFNNVYSYVQLHPISREAWGLGGPVPFFELESQYEQGVGGGPFAAYETDAHGTRIQIYSTILYGARGHIFGNYPLWWFEDLWNTTSGMLDSGSIGAMHAKNILTSRAWYLMIPDTASDIITSGAGTYASESYALSAYASDSSFQISFLPTSRTIQLNAAKISGDSVIYKWFNPRTGDSTLIGTYGKGTQEFTPGSAQDWVLMGIKNE